MRLHLFHVKPHRFFDGLAVVVIKVEPQHQPIIRVVPRFHLLQNLFGSADQRVRRRLLDHLRVQRAFHREPISVQRLFRCLFRFRGRLVDEN